MSEPRHRYVVEATRKVVSHEYGAGTWRLDTRAMVFGFGKGQPYAIGREAERAALLEAVEMATQANYVTVWRMNGGNGSCTHRIEAEGIRYFDKGWGAE